MHRHFAQGGYLLHNAFSNSMTTLHMELPCRIQKCTETPPTTSKRTFMSCSSQKPEVVFSHLPRNEKSLGKVSPDTIKIMNSLASEIKGFSKSHLKKQSTRVTTVTGRQLIETRSGTTVEVTECSTKPGTACGFVQDLSLDLQVGVIKPFLLLCKILLEKYFYQQFSDLALCA